MNEAERCQFELLETVGGKFCYRCQRCGIKTAPTSHTVDRVFCKCVKAVQAGYWADMSCLHRGEVLRQIECRTCGNRGKMVDVHYCAVHGECTLKRAVYLEKPHVCLGCTSHVHRPDAWA